MSDDLSGDMLAPSWPNLVFFVYNDASVPWIMVNKCQFFINISETIFPTNMYYMSLERSFYSASARFCCIEIHGEAAEKLQVKH